MPVTSSHTLTEAVQKLVAQQNELVKTAVATTVRADGMILASIDGKEQIVVAATDQPFFAGAKMRVVKNAKGAGYTAIGTE